MAILRIGLGTDISVLVDRSRSLASLDVLIFPELMDGGYAALAQGALPHRPLDPFLCFLRASTRCYPFTLIAGSMFFDDGSAHPTNTSLTLRRGRIIHRYDKIHLFRPTGDHRTFTPGTRIGCFRLRTEGRSVRAGVVLCYDLRFPELTRMMARQGMQILFVPARWPAARDDAWRTLLKARAIENQVFVAGCNATGKEGGYSYVFDPLGKEVFSSRIPKPLHVVTLRLERRKEALRLHHSIDRAVVLRALPLLRSVTPRRRRP
jgi:omega-amidase